MIALVLAMLMAPDGEPPPMSSESTAEHSATREACPSFDLGGGAGVMWYRASDGNGTDMAGSLAVQGGWHPCLPYLRVEALLATTSRGPPWGQGSEAVEVARLGVDVGVLVGVHLPLIGFDDTPGRRNLGFDALLGPDLLITHSKTTLHSSTSMSDGLRLREGSDTTNTVSLRGVVGLGLSLLYERWRFALRTHTVLPWREVNALVTVAHAL